MGSVPSPKPSIIIAGAGIGGLCCALHLHAYGFTDIHIFEASSTLSTLGVGINVQPSAILILRDLGLLDAITATGIQTGELNYYDRFGNPIIIEPRGINAGYTIPQISIHRGEFQMLLLDAVKERLGADRIHLNHAIVSLEQKVGSITAHFARRKDPSTKPEIPSMNASILIAADGINSTVRSLLYPKEGPPHFSGRMLWRGCLEREPYLTGASMVWAGHANQKFIAYPISSRAQARGKSLVNWIAELRVRAADDPDTTPPKVDWTQTVPKEKFAGEFKSWTFGFLDTPALIAATDRVYEFPMCDRDPVEKWSFGRLTLLGDAAHPMYPIGSNGASQAIIDSQALTEALLAHPEPHGVPEALLAYQNARLPPTAKIVMANRANGPDHVMQVAHERAPDGFKDIHEVIPKDELEGIGSTYKVLVGMEMGKVNEAAKRSEGTAERLGLRGPRAWVT
jgi:2-polyprenyl-6-methoxyphenol hydroxylase-like FAD-dependent oxidoreductase